MKNNYTPEGLNVLTYILAVAQMNEIFQIVQLVLSCLTSIVLIGFRLYKWYKVAKEDGKITKEEINEAIDIIQHNDIDENKKGKEEK